MIKAIIVDDESSAIINLKWEIEQFCPEVKVIDSFTDPVEAISAINYLKPHCVFLDIEMPEMDGFQLLGNLYYRDFDLIITTAFDNYAIKAFKENAIEYLLKPIDADDLKRALDKIKSNITHQNLGFKFKKVIESLNPSLGIKKVALPMAGKTIYRDTNSILYCKSDGNYSEVYFKDDTREVVTLQLKGLEELIDNDKFFRVHNSFYVNLSQVSEYVRTDGPYLVMSNGKSIPVSRAKKEDVINILAK